MTKQETQEIVETYQSRLMTIREIANAAGKPYEKVRRVLVDAGYHNTKHC